MITLTYARIPCTDVISFNVYRSIIGFVAPLNPAANGKTLILKIDGGAPQTITLISDFVVDINAALAEGRAYASLNNVANFLVRTNNRETGSVEIVGGTALSDLALSPMVFTAMSSVVLIANTPVPANPDDPITYQDLDGVLQDYYALSTIDSGMVESSRTSLTRASTPVGPLCTIEGTAVDLSGNPVPDVAVTASLISLPTHTNARSYINNQVLNTLTDTQGNFCITVLQEALIRLQIPAIFYDQTVEVPQRSFVVLSQLQINTRYRYPTEVIG